MNEKLQKSKFFYFHIMVKNVAQSRVEACGRVDKAKNLDST